MTTEHVAVVGAGQMGAGIAQVLLQSGLKVPFIEVSAPMLDRGSGRLRGGLQKLLEKGKLDDARRQSALSRFRTASAIASVQEVDFAIEAVTENEGLKIQIFRELDSVVRPGGVLASNTSSIPITRLAASTGRPEAVIGMHFMNPVPLMSLVGIIPGAVPSGQTYAHTRPLAPHARKTPVVS